MDAISSISGQKISFSTQDGTNGGNQDLRLAATSPSLKVFSSLSIAPKQGDLLLVQNYAVT